MENKSELNYENRIVGFIDILGFKDIISKSETNKDYIDILFNTLNFLKKRENSTKWNLSLIEIEEDFQKKNTYEKIQIEDITNCTSFSDSIVVSMKFDENNINEITSILISNLSYIGAKLLLDGILIRGGITIGNLIHTENGILLGKALIEAYELESKFAQYPRIILSGKLIKKLNYPLFEKKNRHPYHQYLGRFDDGTVGFHQMIYFQVLQNSELLSNEDLILQINKIKKNIINGLDDNFDRPDIYNKFNWLKNMYQNLYLNSSDNNNLNDLDNSDKNIHFDYFNK